MSETDGADARLKWKAHLEAAQREGLTLAAYSRAHGIAKNRLYEERQRLREASMPGTTKKPASARRAKRASPKAAADVTPFARVRVSAAQRAPMPSRLLAQLPNGATVELECTAGDASLVSALIETLGRCDVPARR
jgi:transposase